MPSPLEKRLKELDKQRAKGVVTEDEYQARRTAIISDPGAQESGRRGGLLRWGLMGCFGMLAAIGVLVVIVVVIIVVSVGGSSGSFKDTHVAFANGSSGTVTAGSIKNKVTIDKITDPAVSSNEFEQPQAGHHYMTVAVTIENVGTRETTGLDVKLRTKDGTEYDRTFITGVGASDLSTFQSLTSGGRTDGVLAFEVKDGSTVQWLKFDPNPFTKGDLYFDKQ